MDEMKWLLGFALKSNQRRDVGGDVGETIVAMNWSLLKLGDGYMGFIIVFFSIVCVWKFP